MSKKRSRGDREQILRWVERVATFFSEHYGLPPITGRILGWLMISDPPEQSSAEIATAIGASRASLSTNMRLLTATGLVRRRAHPGSRTTYYRLEDDAWEQVIQRRLASLASFREITEDGMTLVGRDSARAKRIRAAHDIFEWTATLLAKSPGPPLSKRGR